MSLLTPKQQKHSKAKLKRHSANIRGLGVCVAAKFRKEPCSGDIQSCHIRDGFCCAGDKPVGMEIPMCHHHHIEVQHRIGEDAFYSPLYGGIEAAKNLAQKLWVDTGKRQECFMHLARFMR